MLRGVAVAQRPVIVVAPAPCSAVIAQAAAVAVSVTYLGPRGAGDARERDRARGAQVAAGCTIAQSAIAIVPPAPASTIIANAADMEAAGIDIGPCGAGCVDNGRRTLIGGAVIADGAIAALPPAPGTAIVADAATVCLPDGYIRPCGAAQTARADE